MARREGMEKVLVLVEVAVAVVLPQGFMWRGAVTIKVMLPT